MRRVSPYLLLAMLTGCALNAGNSVAPPTTGTHARHPLSNASDAPISASPSSPSDLAASPSATATSATATATPAPLASLGTYFPLQKGLTNVYEQDSVSSSGSLTPSGDETIALLDVSTTSSVTAADYTVTTSSQASGTIGAYSDNGAAITAKGADGVIHTLLKAPLHVGDTWKDTDGTTVLVKRLGAVSTPYNDFAAALEVDATAALGSFSKTYYVDGIGMVSQERTANGAISELRLTQHYIKPPATPMPSPTPTPSPSPSFTMSPSVVPSAPQIDPTTFSGTVYDETGAAVSGAKVEAKSLNSSAPFDTTVDVDSGNYIINGVPAGVSIQVTVTKTGYTSRTRVVTLLPLSSSQPNVVDFGGSDNSTDPSGPPYFVSNFPEVTSVSPADESTGNSAITYDYVLTLSEPLDQTNQSRFRDEIHIWPDNPYAIPGQSVTPTDFRTAASIGNLPTATDLAGSIYAISSSSYFGPVGTTATIATVSFDSTGQVATLTFNAPLLTTNTNAPRYQIGLVVPANATPVDDGNGHQLGVASWGGNFNSLASGNGSAQPVFEGFESPSLSTTNPGGGAAAWKDTHVNTTYFDLAQDNTAPTLTAVAVDKVAGSSRINLTFSKPMAAYDGAPGTDCEYLPAANTNVANYVFAFGTSSNDVANVDLTGTAQTVSAFSQVPTGTPVVFANGAATIDVDPNNPAVVRLTAGTNDVLSSSLGVIKVRAVNVQDPAGNPILDTNATNVQTGII